MSGPAGRERRYAEACRRANELAAIADRTGDVRYLVEALRAHEWGEEEGRCREE